MKIHVLLKCKKTQWWRQKSLNISEEILYKKITSCVKNKNWKHRQIFTYKEIKKLENQLCKV